MRFGEECCCRAATGRLFRLAVNQIHWTEIPPGFWERCSTPIAKSPALQKARVISATLLLISRGNGVAPQFFWDRGGDADRPLVPAPHLRCNMATKKPSVPKVRGVMSNVSADPSADCGGAAENAACSHTRGQGTMLNPGRRERKASAWPRFSGASTEQVT